MSIYDPYKWYTRRSSSISHYKYYLFWLVLLVGLQLLLGCANYKTYSERYAEWEKDLRERDWSIPPPGYDGGIVIDIIVPEGSYIYLPSTGGSYEYIEVQP